MSVYSGSLINWFWFTAPIVLAVFAKLLMLLGLGKAVLVTSILGGAKDSSYEVKTSYSPPSKSYSSDSLGRIKRSVEFVDGIVGKVSVNSNRMLLTAKINSFSFSSISIKPFIIILF